MANFKSSRLPGSLFACYFWPLSIWNVLRKRLKRSVNFSCCVCVGDSRALRVRVRGKSVRRDLRRYARIPSESRSIPASGLRANRPYLEEINYVWHREIKLKNYPNDWFRSRMTIKNYPHWTKSGRSRPELKFNFKYFWNREILPNLIDSTIKHSFSCFTKISQIGGALSIWRAFAAA